MAKTKIFPQGRTSIPPDCSEKGGPTVADGIELIYNDVTGHCAIAPKIQSIRELKGCVPRPAVPLTVEQMDAIIGRCGAAADSRDRY